MAVYNNTNISNMLSPDLGVTCLSYLAYPQLDRRMDEVFDEDPPTALVFYKQQLHSIYNMPDTSLVKRVYTILNGKAPLQETLAQQAREKVLATREAAVSLIRQGEPLLSKDEWQQQPAKPHPDDAAWTFEQINQMGNAISARRAENLVNFFNWLRAQPGVAVDNDFVERMRGNELTLRQKAHDIRLWLKENGSHLPLTAIDAVPLEGFREIPRELLYLPLDVETFMIAGQKAVKKGSFGFISKVIKSRRFVEHSPLEIAYASNALRDAFESGHLAIVQAIMESGIPLDVTFGELLSLACRWGHFPIAKTLMESPQFDDDLSEDSLSSTFWKTCDCGHLAIAIALIANRRFHDISADSLSRALICACSEGHLTVVQALKVSGRFHQLLAADLGLALWHASKSGHLAVVQTLIASDRFREIEPFDLFAAFTDALNEGHIRVALKLLCTLRGGVAIPSLALLSAGYGFPF